MDDLIELMQQIDLNSKVLPEGSYLEMCNRMKNIYKSLSHKQVELPTTTRQQQNAPFQVRMPFDDDDEDVIIDDIDDDDFFMRDRRLDEIYDRIDILERERAKFEPWKKMSAQRKKEAVKERAELIGIRLRSYTIEALRENNVVIGDEKTFFRNYMVRRNLLNRERYDEITEEIRYLEEERNGIRALIHVVF